MHSRVNETYQKLAEKYELKGPFLEVGVGNKEAAILSGHYFLGKPGRFATNLSSMEILDEEEHAIKFIRCNSNNMRDVFADGQFGTILSNAVIEHDKYFWRSLDEMKRILAPGGILAIGAPGYLPRKQLKTDVINEKLSKATVTMDVHSAPDYWRFSRMAFKEVICEGLELLELSVVLRVPVLVAVARKPLDGLLAPVAQEDRMLLSKGDKEAKLQKREARDARLKARQVEAGIDASSEPDAGPGSKREARLQEREARIKAREAKAQAVSSTKTDEHAAVKPRDAKLQAREMRLQARKAKPNKIVATADNDDPED